MRIINPFLPPESHQEPRKMVTRIRRRVLMIVVTLLNLETVA